MGHPDEPTLIAHALGRLPESAAELEAHLGACPRCRAVVREHFEELALLVFSGEPEPPLVGGLERLAARIALMRRDEGLE